MNIYCILTRDRSKWRLDSQYLYEPLYVMSIVLRVMVLIVEGRITGRPVHHAGRLSVHHVAHRRVRTVCPARSCRQWWKHYTLLRLDLCSVIGRRVLDKLAATLSKVLEELENSMTTRYSLSLSLGPSPPHRKEMGWRRSRGERVEGRGGAVWCDSPKSRSRLW